jgi:hypothetical protein
MLRVGNAAEKNEEDGQGRNKDKDGTERIRKRDSCIAREHSAEHAIKCGVCHDDLSSTRPKVRDKVHKTGRLLEHSLAPQYHWPWLTMWLKRITTTPSEAFTIILKSWFKIE